MADKEVLDKLARELGFIPEHIFLDGVINIISIDNKNIEYLPDYIGDFESLEILYLKNNKLKSLPDTISKLVFLRKLILSNNQLEFLPDLSKLSDLEVIELENNKLKQLPEGNYTLLKKLSAFNNQIEEIPKTILGSKLLEELNLENNLITSIPDELLYLHELEILNLANNQLSALPPSIASLVSLKRVNLSNNSLSSLPRGFERMPELRELNLLGNNLDLFINHYVGHLPIQHEFLPEYMNFLRSDHQHECQSCGYVQPIGLVTCGNCGIEIFHCFTCKFGFSGERMSCRKCKTNFHEDHLYSVLIFSPKCPSCGNKSRFEDFEKL